MERGPVTLEVESPALIAGDVTASTIKLYGRCFTQSSPILLLSNFKTHSLNLFQSYTGLVRGFLP